MREQRKKQRNKETKKRTKKQTDTVASLGTGDTPGLRILASKIEAAIAHPKQIERRPHDQATGFLADAENERLTRLIAVISSATELFGSVDAAVRWLRTPADYMNNGTEVAPLTLATMGAGARTIESLLLQTAHGVL
ncbi:hypothetical protein CH75_16725 [Dyella jiangningensis]|nr:hypothetical protein CH75_16725 [Dyella jiangningensis]